MYIAAGTEAPRMQAGLKATLAVLLVVMAMPVLAQRLTETREVTATAFNSLPGQGAGEDHTLAAWGDILMPGMRAIAVSRDLIALGLDHGTPVRIEGLEGIWYVRDKMNARWRNKIDIYMGEDLRAALNWGRRRVTIHWAPAPP